MDEHGGLNEGVVTPADMLSFARQVAMAMVRTQFFTQGVMRKNAFWRFAVSLVTV